MSLTADELKQAILDALAGNTVLSMATRGPDAVHAVSLLYAHQGFDLYWLSDPKSSHSIQLVNECRCAVTIARQQAAFQTIQGLQLSGLGFRLDPGTEADAGFTLMTQRYEFLRNLTAGDLARHLGKAAVYRFRPKQITLIDNSHGFGFKQVLQFQISGENS